MKKNDFVLFVVLLIAAGFSWIILVFFGNSKRPERVVVYQNKVMIAEYSLDKDVQVSLENEDGGYNQLIIQKSEAWIEDADCPDKLCVHQGKISKSGQTIICLPHKLVIQLEGNDVTELDGMVQ